MDISTQKMAYLIDIMNINLSFNPNVFDVKFELIPFELSKSATLSNNI